MDLQQLCVVLQSCLSPDAQLRKGAEDLLVQHEASKGQVINLLRVAAEESVDIAVRQVAAITFKRLVRRSWDPPASDTTTYRLPEDEKTLVKDNILESLIRAPHAAQVQLGEVFKTIVYNDFPANWPGLQAGLVQNLASQEPLRVHGGLYALRLVVRKYEMRDSKGEEADTQAALVHATFPVLLHIFQHLLASPVLTPEVCLYIKLVLKCFWSATYMAPPDLLLQPEHFRGWMAALLAAVHQDLPEDQQPARKEERPAMAWWKSRKWLLHVTYHMFTRCGNPKHAKEGNERTFALMWAAEWTQPFLDAHLALIVRLASGRYMTPRTTNLLFQYVDHCLNIKSCYKHGAAYWDDMLLNVAFPIMCFSDDDAELWQEDPQEYIRKGYDIMEDMFSPKTAVANYAHSLCQKSAAHLNKFMAAMVGVLQQYVALLAAGGALDPGLVRRADGALLAVGAMASLLKGKKPYKSQLGGMLSNLVAPCFASPAGHLRAKAAWVAGCYSDTQFTDGCGSGPSFLALLAKVVGLLSDPELPVRVDAVVALRHFIDEAEDTESIKPILPQILGAIFQLMGEVDAEELVFTLETLVQKFGTDIAPYAAQMMTQLVAAFNKYMAAVDEEDDEDEGTASIAAYECLRAINTLLDSLSGLGPELYLAIEDALLPLVMKLLSTDGQDVVEEVLEMLAYLTFFGPGITPKLWSCWPLMHAMLMDWAIDSWDSFLIPLDNMITRDTHTFLHSKEPNYLESVFQLASHSLSGDYSDKEVVPAAKLLQLVLQTCRGSIDNWVGPYIGLALQRLPRTEHNSLKDALVQVVAAALYYNPLLTLRVLVESGTLASFFSGWVTMILATRASSGKAVHFRSMQDKKVCILGLLALVGGVPAESLPAEVASSSHVVLSGAVTLLSRLKAQAEAAAAAEAEEADDEEEDGEEDEDDVNEGEDWGLDDAEDKEDEEDEEYMKKLSRKAKELFGDDDDSASDFTDDESDMQTAIDAIDPFILLADTLAGISAAAPERHQRLVAACTADPSGAAALEALLRHAEVQRQEKAKAAASIAV